jgi:predicted RecB family nuclease
MPVIISDQDLQDYIDPSKCKRRVGLRLLKAPEDAADDYLSLLAELTAGVIAGEKTRLGAIDLSHGTSGFRSAVTAQHMQELALSMYKPFLTAATDVSGTACILTGSPDFLVLSDDGKGYKIRLCDASRAVSDNSPAEVHARLKFFSHLYELAFKTKPAALEIVDGTGSIVSVMRAKNLTQSVKEDLKNILAALLAKHLPYEPVGRSKCIMCPFHHRCWPEAEERGDVSLVIGVDQGLAHALHDAGITSTASLLKHFGDNQSGLANLERRWGFSKRPVGKENAQTIMRFAGALATGEESLIANPDMPDSSHYAMFDLEGLPDRLDPLGPIYLWGLQVFNPDGTAAESYAPAVAPFGPAGDKQGWQAFLEGAENIRRRFGPIPFVHWDKYERNRLDAYIARLGDPNGTAARVCQQLVDLRKVVQESLVLPISSYSLKVVEKHAGYHRTQDEFGTNWSIKQYVRARDTADGTVRRETMEKLLKYNQEDLEAMAAVMVWFRERANALVVREEG